MHSKPIWKKFLYNGWTNTLKLIEKGKTYQSTL